MADYIVDLGREGGRGGGEIMFSGTPEEITRLKDNYTGMFLAPVLEH